MTAITRECNEIFLKRIILQDKRVLSLRDIFMTSFNSEHIELEKFSLNFTLCSLDNVHLLSMYLCLLTVSEKKIEF